jgi:hypothetical protein
MIESQSTVTRANQSAQGLLTGTRQTNDHLPVHLTSQHQTGCFSGAKDEDITVEDPKRSVRGRGVLQKF